MHGTLAMWCVHYLRSSQIPAGWPNPPGQFAMRLGQSHLTGSGVMSAAQREMSGQLGSMSRALSTTARTASRDMAHLVDLRRGGAHSERR